MTEDYFKEVKQMIKELVESQKKTDAQIQRLTKKTDAQIQRLTKKTDAQIQRLTKKTDAQLRRTSEEIRKTSEEIRKTSEENRRTSEELRRISEESRRTDEELRRISEESQRITSEEFRKTDEAIRRTSEEIQKTDEEIRKVNRLVAGISDGFGRMTEGFALASIEKIFEYLGIHINKTISRIISRKDGHHLEIDLLNLAKSDKKELVIVVEVKTYLRTQDVDDFLDDISKFYDFFEEYRDKEVIGAIAFMNYAQGAKEYAEKNGLYLLFCSEDLMELVNKKEFAPQVWKYEETLIPLQDIN